MALYAAFLIVAAFFAPVTAGLGYGFLLQFSNVAPEYRSAIIIIGMFAIATVLGLRIPARYSLPLLAYLWYLAQTDFPSGVYFPISFETAIFLFVLLLVAWAVGWILRAFLITRERQADRLKAELERERERTVKALHGSVASSLTSVVLRSEALAMSGDEQTAKAAKLIAEDARRSMQEVRQLIRFMRSDDPAAFNEDTATHTPALGEALRSFSDTLRSHGYTVAESGLQGEGLNSISLRHAPSAFREIQTNVIKYADKHRPVIVAAVEDDNDVQILVQNIGALEAQAVEMSTGVGLGEVSSLLKEDGATLDAGYHGEAFRYHLTVPKERK
ncbi:Histidine kinase [Corynebacterium afermentans subsp. lipophilum]|nr:Histidine kinase [Corynebacterium afermentans subsp. lipophilum]